MRSNNLIIFILLLTQLSFAINYKLSYQTTAYGEPGSQSQVTGSIENHGSGGILAYYYTTNGWVLATSSCISPDTTGTFNIPLTFSSGRQTIQVSLLLMDFWGLLSGDKCPKTATDYQTANSNKYSSNSSTLTIETYSGCQYGYPNCDSNHECINNECELKKGCQYNNPPCSDSYYCQNNQCILKPGCQYDNPPCSYGYVCEQNTCLAIITSEIESNYRSKVSVLESQLHSLDLNATRLIEVWSRLNDSGKVAYWTNVQNFARNSYANLSYTKSLIVYPRKKSEVIESVINYLTQIESIRASLMKQNPNPISIDTSEYTITAPVIQNQSTDSVTTTTITPITTITTQVSLSSVQQLLSGFPEMQNLDNGRTITFVIFGNDGKTRSYYIEKLSSGFSVEQKNIDTDIALSMDEDSFLQLLNSQNKCSTLRSLTETSISAVPLADTLTLLSFCKLKNCISSIALPQISNCLIG